MTLKRCKPTRRDKRELLQKVTSRGAFVSGRDAGISAYKYKDTTSKETGPTSRNGRRSFEDDPRPDRPSTDHTEETVARVREIIRADRRLTIREVAEDVGIAFGTCQKILTEDLQMRRVSGEFVPRLLTAEQDDRVPICTDLRERAQNDPNFMSSVITGDESWVYGYDTETKQMSSQWKTASSPRPKKARQVKSSVKIVDCVLRH